ncbi:uncharacterized protein LOC124161117 isoform X2 [Ischnura elegans]|uniref:uncharacterized protein LOC124161117 isoform X2 n=1 Tax=Ischnura elegans TaxID=197161 RepID=UPI001ED8B1BD|nr:uncharacterized protein LOC124161117 isoform X2 [Ischnura elegans]
MRWDNNKQMQKNFALENENQIEGPVSQTLDLVELLAGLFVNNLIKEAEFRVITLLAMENEQSESGDKNEELTSGAPRESSESCKQEVEKVECQDEQERHSTRRAVSDPRPNVETHASEDPAGLEASGPDLSSESLTVNVSDDVGDSGKDKSKDKTKDCSSPEEKRFTPVEEELKRLLEEISIIDFGTGHLAVSVEMEPKASNRETAMRRKREVVVGERGDCCSLAAGNEPSSPGDEANHSPSEVSWELSAEESLNSETEEVLSVVEPTYSSGGRLVIREISSSSAPPEEAYNELRPTFNARDGESCFLGETQVFGDDNANFDVLISREKELDRVATPRGAAPFNVGINPPGGEISAVKSDMSSCFQKSESQEAEDFEDAMDEFNMGVNIIKELKNNVCCFRGSMPDRYNEVDVNFESGDMIGFEHGGDGYLRQSLENLNHIPSSHGHSKSSFQSSYDSDLDKLNPSTILSSDFDKDVIYDGNIAKCIEGNTSSSSPLSEKEKEDFHSPPKLIVENTPRDEFLDESNLLTADPKLSGGDTFSTNVNELLLENEIDCTESKQHSLSLESSSFSLYETDYQVNYLSTDDLQLVNVPPEFLQFDDPERNLYMKTKGDDVTINIQDTTWNRNGTFVNTSEEECKEIEIYPASETDNDMIYSVEEDDDGSNVFDMANDFVYLEGYHKELLRQTPLRGSHVNSHLESWKNKDMEVMGEAKRRLDGDLSIAEKTLILQKNAISERNNERTVPEEIQNNASTMKENDEESTKKISDYSSIIMASCEREDDSETSCDGDFRLDKTYLVSERDSAETSKYSKESISPTDSIQSAQLGQAPTKRLNETNTLSKSNFDDRGREEYALDTFEAKTEQKMGNVICQETSCRKLPALEKNEVSSEDGVHSRNYFERKEDLREVLNSRGLSGTSQSCSKESIHKDNDADAAGYLIIDRSESISITDLKELNEIASQFNDPEICEKIIHPRKNIPDSLCVEAKTVSKPSAKTIHNDFAEQIAWSEKTLNEEQAQTENNSDKKNLITKNDGINLKGNLCGDKTNGLDSHTNICNTPHKEETTDVMTAVSCKHCMESDPSHICSGRCLLVNDVQPRIISTIEKTEYFQIGSNSKELPLDSNVNKSSESLKKNNSNETAVKNADDHNAVTSEDGNCMTNLNENPTIGNNQVSGNRSLESLYAFEYNTQPESADRISCVQPLLDNGSVSNESQNILNSENALLESNDFRICEQYENLVKKTEEIVRRYEQLKNWRLSLVENMVFVEDMAQSEDSSTSVPNVLSGSLAEELKSDAQEGSGMKEKDCAVRDGGLDASKERPPELPRIAPIGSRASIRMFNCMEEMSDSTRKTIVQCRSVDGLSSQLNEANSVANEQKEEDKLSEITSSAPPLWDDATLSDNTVGTLEGRSNSGAREEQYENPIVGEVNTIVIGREVAERGREAREDEDRRDASNTAGGVAGTKMAVGSSHVARRRVARTAEGKSGGGRGARAKSPTKKDKSRGKSEEGSLSGRKRRRKDGNEEETAGARKASSLGEEEIKRAKGRMWRGAVEGKTDKERTGRRVGWKFGRRVKNFVFSALGMQRSPKH